MTATLGMKSQVHSAVFAVLVLIGFAFAGCKEDQQPVTGPISASNNAPLSAAQIPNFDSALAVHRRHTMRLIALPGVVATAVGATADGRPAIKVFVKKSGASGLPRSLEGLPVEVEATGEFVAGTCTPSTCSNTDVWPTPVPIGVSTGPDLTAFCGNTGTIGARVKAGGVVYALSNNHIYAGENGVPLGTNESQPGLTDVGCSATGTNVIGTLSAFAPIGFCSPSCPQNTIDAAIAASSVASLDNKTPPAGYGTPLSAVWSATVGLAVKKYGRTTSLTTGTVNGIDATVTVGYPNGNAGLCSSAHDRFVPNALRQGRRLWIPLGHERLVRQPCGIALRRSHRQLWFVRYSQSA